MNAWIYEMALLMTYSISVITADKALNAYHVSWFGNIGSEEEMRTVRSSVDGSFAFRCAISPINTWFWRLDLRENFLIHTVRITNCHGESMYLYFPTYTCSSSA